MITPAEALSRCIEHREIFHDEMLHLMRMLMRGEMSPTIAAALLMGLRVKKETIGEITAAATVMREFATPVHVPNPEALVDMCGTGGDGSNTFNISTAAMFVVAAAGVPIAKHGGRRAAPMSLRRSGQTSRFRPSKLLNASPTSASASCLRRHTMAP